MTKNTQHKRKSAADTSRVANTVAPYMNFKYVKHLKEKASKVVGMQTAFKRCVETPTC